MIQSAHAILLLNGHYVLQLRDDKPSIPAADQWSLFGGRVEEDEDPAYTVEREVREELSITPTRYSLLWCDRRYAEFEKEVIEMWFFEARVDEVWSQHRLREGRAVRAFRFDELPRSKMPPVMLEAIQRYHAERL